MKTYEATLRSLPLNGTAEHIESGCTRFDAATQADAQQQAEDWLAESYPYATPILMWQSVGFDYRSALERLFDDDDSVVILTLHSLR